MSKFFIHRPVFAWVLAIIMMIAGGLAILQLPIAQYPTIAPPAVAISATYPGADAQTVQDTVTQVIEQNMNGIDKYHLWTNTKCIYCFFHSNISCLQNINIVDYIR